jgi:hypothetical protein
MSVWLNVRNATKDSVYIYSDLGFDASYKVLLFNVHTCRLQTYWRHLYICVWVCTCMLTSVTFLSVFSQFLFPIADRPMNEWAIHFGVGAGWVVFIECCILIRTQHETFSEVGLLSKGFGLMLQRFVPFIQTHQKSPVWNRFLPVEINSLNIFMVVCERII